MKLKKDEIIDEFNRSTEEHRTELLDQEDEETAEEFMEDWYRLTDVIISPGKVILIMDRDVEEGDGEQILHYAFGFTWHDRHEVEYKNTVIVNPLDI